MRVVHLIWGLNTGGAETMLIDIINEQSSIVEAVLLIGNAVADAALLEQISPKVKVILLNRPPGSRNPWYLFKLYKMLKGLEPDIIHSHLQSFITVTRFLDVPKVLTVHNTGICLTRKTLNNYDAIYSISETVKTDLARRYPQASSIVVHNGIVFSKIVQKSSYNNFPFRIVQISRLDHRQKGQDILLRALRRVNDMIGTDKVTVDFIGEGSSMGYLIKLAEDLGVAPWCKFLGRRSRQYIYKNLHNYDLLVQPSRYEGFGLVVVEAMAALVPVLVSDVEGPMELIDYGQYGYFFRSEDYESCANKIIEIMQLSKEHKFIEDRKKVVEYAKMKFDVALTASRYLDEYIRVTRIKRA